MGERIWISISRWVLCLVGVLVLAVVLPRMFDMAFKKSSPSSFVLYSPVTEGFLFSGNSPEGEFRYRDEAGNLYDRKTYMSLTPLFWYRDLFAWKIMPETLGGVPITREAVEAGAQFFRYRPGDMQREGIALWPLLESASEFSDLRLPETLFWNKGRLIFENGLTRRRDATFTEAVETSLSDAGFVFPVAAVWGNPTTKKPHDDGWFLLDAEGRLFHLKQEKGLPICRNTGLAPPSGIRHVAVTEDARKEFFGYLITGDGGFHVLMQENYALVRLDLEDFDPDTMGLLFMADLLGRTLVYGDGEGFYALRLDREYRPLHRYTEARFPAFSQGTAVARAILFPFTLKTRASYTKAADFALVPSGLLSLVGILFAFLSFVLIRKKMEKPLCPGIREGVVLLLGGLYGLLVLCVEDGWFRGEKGQSRS
ncbi:DUF4857 domain-containing protein [Desulfobotulus sp.]|uniref:DUF4857 domain-containing protein n=1 Tax=Desulfobotulus sp. TaxID=1940337 RepID=UPI002A36DCBA|nr:DUF4857 domain-containing protein [Desulfobotulus sp.]MDY0162801.1 DUF4857 domain-containing protein [Desulfobotulus sp.]